VYCEFNTVLTEDNGRLFPIPVRIKNIKVNGIDLNTEVFPSTSSEFHKRFSLVDTLVGKEGGVLKYVRLPVSIRLWFQKAVSHEAGKISTPILDIDYMDKPVSSLQSESKISVRIPLIL
jgi:hypothetical protein